MDTANRPGETGPTGTGEGPRDTGIGRATAAVIDGAERTALDLHSILVMRGGKVVAEAYRPPFDADSPHRMYSVTKSFTSSAVGLAVADGRLTVKDRVVDLFPELIPDPVDPHLGELRVEHLLTMSAQHGMVAGPGTATARPVPSVAGFLAEPMSLRPGTRFDYSNGCSYLLAAIVERVTGERLADFLRRRLFAPLGIAASHWVCSPEGVANGGWGLHLTARELARLGQLYLQGGIWEGTRILSEAWIAEATGKRVESWGNAGMPDWRQGYGYQFWRGRHGSYRADGLLGQFCVVLPALDALVVTTAGTLSTQVLLDLLWTHLVPALSRPAPEEGVAPAFADTNAGAGGSPREAELSGLTFELGERFSLPTRYYGGQVPIVAVEVSPAESGAIALGIRTEQGSYRLPVGLNRWSGGTSPVSTGYPEPYAGFARWERADLLVVDLVFTEAGFRLGFGFDLEARQVTVTLPANPGLERRRLIGRPFP